MTSSPSSGTQWTNQITIAPAPSAGVFFHLKAPEVAGVAVEAKSSRRPRAARNIAFCLHRHTGEAAPKIAQRADGMALLKPMVAALHPFPWFIQAPKHLRSGHTR